MDNIRAVIDTLFSQINSSAILAEFFKAGRLSDTLGVTEEMFCQKFIIENKCYTLDQVHELYDLVISEWMKNPLLHLRQKKDDSDLFYILLHYTTEILTEIDSQPICRYNQLLRWRMLVYKLGEDLFTTSFLAFNDIQQRTTRKTFYWSPVILQDNPAIEYILRKGLTDLHFHLRGSSLNYELNWISLMNNIQNRKADFMQLKKCLSHRTSTMDKEKWDSFYLATIKACAIRYYLFLILRHPQYASFFEGRLHGLLQCDNDILIQGNGQEMGTLQQYINNAKYRYGYKAYVKGAFKCMDYAIPMDDIRANRIADINLPELILSGERSLLYGMFHRIYSKVSTYGEKMLFYVYLLQKELIRKELVQLNEREGFGNFADYESRKELFIENREEYQNAVPRLALDMAFANGYLKYLECRVTPRKTSQELLLSISRLERQIGSKWPFTDKKQEDGQKRNYYYILHFIKRQDKTDDYLPKDRKACIQCRHFSLRHDIRQQGMATLEALKKYRNLRECIVGIDAANTELYCRPEVFGPVYRCMKRSYNVIGGDCMDRRSLKFTYHVGEDFWDITDGLRAIDEAILFLNLDSNDRLGHALALGTNVESYYRFRNFRVVMTKQNLMDNAMWMLRKAKELNIQVSNNVALELQKIFNEYYDEIYLKNELGNYPEGGSGNFSLLQQGKDIHLYYQSWLLRGDDPEFYRRKVDENDFAENPYHSYSLWDITALNVCHESMVRARKNKVVVKLYKSYHYDAAVRRVGNERCELKLSSEIILLIGQIQHKMCHQIASLHLGIEANITSNQFIGSMNKYIQHPIVTLYQLGLSIENENNHCCPQMSVSINTDDRGIFDTSIEEEYALLALALEKEVDSQHQPRYQPRYIYEWLNNIRKMGFEQQFKKKDASKY